MKTVKKFKECENIPDNAKFLYKETTTQTKYIDCDCHALLNCNCREVIYTNWFYYEVEVDNESV